MQVRVAFTVLGVHDRRVTRPIGILRRHVMRRPHIAKDNAGTVRVLAHAAGTNEWLSFPQEMLTISRLECGCR